MAEPKPLTADELERLMADLDEGAYDEMLVPPGDKAALALKFANLKPFDVRAWAERRGLKLPSR